MIGVSALLTTTMEEQRKVVKLVKERGLPFKTVIGGAPATQRWADQIGADAYAEDATVLGPACRSTSCRWPWPVPPHRSTWPAPW